MVQTGFVDSHLFEIDLLTVLEPGIPGGETPPSTAGETPAATEARFMESHLFEIDLLTALEPRNCKSLEINETISRFMESALFEIDLLTVLEPGIPGGETPPLYGRRDARRYGKKVHGEGCFPQTWTGMGETAGSRRSGAAG